jgi:hypothetical protein
MPYKKINTHCAFNTVLLVCLVAIMPIGANSQAKAKLKVQEFIFPAQTWLDNRSMPINAHGGGLLFFNGIYYWYGEHKIEGKSEEQFADGGIHCYSSNDLMNWTDAGIVLGVDYNTTSTADLAYGCLIERPKVVYNEKTKNFIAYFKFYPKGMGYEIAYVGVATAVSPTGPFTYSHKFLAAGSPKGSGDFSMFKDDDGALYHLAVRKPDKTFVMTKMRDDFLLPLNEYQICKGIEPHTEAPALLKLNGVYHLLGSGSTGWKPNAARYYTSKSLTGTWQPHGNPCTGYNSVDSIGIEKTYGAQSTFIFKIQGLQNAYIAMFDIWKPNKPIDGRYIWLPIVFKENKLTINWVDKWNTDAFKK